MSALTSLLVRDRVIPVSKIEDALQQQVLSGTDIDTVLLEMNLVSEDVLAAYRAAAFGLLPATREEVMRAPRDAIDHCPPTLAVEHAVVPILREGKALVVAAAEPPSADAIALLSHATGCEVSVRVVTAPRVRAALLQHYGAALDPRTARLVEQLRRREPGIIPYVRPAAATQRPFSAASAQPVGSSSSSSSAGPAADHLLRELGLSEGASLRSPRSVTSVTVVEARAITDEHPPALGREADARATGSLVRSAAEPSDASDSEDGEAASAPRKPRALSTMPPPSISASVSRAARGPVSETRLTELLAEATQRDEVLYVLLRYAAQFFDFVTLFTISKDAARGRLSHGAGLSAEVLEQVYVPLSGNGVFARAVRDKRPTVGDIGSSSEERMAAALLGRPSQRPGLAVPFVLQGRAVILLFAERDGEGLSEADAGPILAIAGPVSQALRRLILETKTLSRSQPPGPLAGEPAEPELEPHAGLSAPGLQDLAPVDLDTMAHLSQPAWNDAVPHADGASTPSWPGDARDSVPGVPKSAPPPPPRASLAPPPPARASLAPAANKQPPLAGDPFGDTSGPGGAPSASASMPPSAGAYSFGSRAAPAPETIRPSREIVASARSEAVAFAEPSREAEAEVEQPSATVAQATPPTIVVATPPKRLALVPKEPEASVIIDMGEPVRVLVDQLANAAPNDPMPELRELLRIGESALPVLIQRFPGPLWFDIRQIQVRAPFGRDVSAIALAIVSFGERAAPYLATLLGTASGPTAVCALLVAGELVQPELMDAVCRRVLDPDGDVRYVALCALRAYTRLPQFPSVIRALSDISERPGKDPRRQRLAVEALGELRDHRALRTLLARLGDSQETISVAAHRALVELTLQDFGPSARKWEPWVQELGARHRVEWLIHALMHTDPGLRAVAADELKRVTQQYFGYHPALPKRERELAQRKYREWWEREGQRQFAG